MPLTFQKESFIKIMPELPPLFVRHHDEIEEDKSSPLDPAWGRYAAMEIAGQLHIMTARAEGKLVGYYFTVVVTQLHHQTRLCAWSDMFYLLPAYRKGWNGVRLIRETEKMLKSLGAKKSYLVTKYNHPLIIILKYLGYILAEQVHTKML